MGSNFLFERPRGADLRVDVINLWPPQMHIKYKKLLDQIKVGIYCADSSKLCVIIDKGRPQ